MIRALVDYQLKAPVITSPEDVTYTNESTLTVEGTSSANVDITLYNQGEETATTETDENGHFSADIELGEGENEITAVASVESGDSDPSDPITVILDTEQPELTIESPSDGDKVNTETITVTGSVHDSNLDTVTVNGEEADVNEDGSFSKRIILDNGLNEINVIAKDLAGNETEESMTIDVKYTAPVIENLQPEEDLSLNAGESVKIEFTSEPGLDATFIIRMPLTNTVANANELPMRETSEGNYVGYWTATSNVEAEGAEIEVIAKDDYGNETREVAEGKLNINIEE